MQKFKFNNKCWEPKKRKWKTWMKNWTGCFRIPCTIDIIQIPACSCPIPSSNSTSSPSTLAVLLFGLISPYSYMGFLELPVPPRGLTTVPVPISWLLLLKYFEISYHKEVSSQNIRFWDEEVYEMMKLKKT